MFEALMVLLLSFTATLTVFVPSDEGLRVAFEQGQKFYVLEDYHQAIEQFEVIRRAERSRFVNEEKILLEVGGTQLPVRVAATYQLGNCYRNLAAEDLKKAEEDKEEAKRLRQRAGERFLKGADSFKEAARITGIREVKVLSQYQLIKTSYQAGDYQRTIEEARIMLES